MPIEIEASVDFRQYLKMIFLLSLPRLLPFILLTLGVIISVFYLSSADRNTNWLLVTTVSFVAIILLFAFLIYQSARKQYKNAPVLHQRIKYFFTDDRVEVAGNSFNSTLGWDMLIKAKEVGSFFLVFGTLNTAFFLPLSAFEDETQIDEFRRLLREKFGKKAKLKK